MHCSTPGWGTCDGASHSVEGPGASFPQRLPSDRPQFPRARSVRLEGSLERAHAAVHACRSSAAINFAATSNALRHRDLLFILPFAILAACGGPATTADPVLPPPAAAPLAELQCDSLEGLAFAVTYYLDNQPQGTDVLRFHDHRMGCDGCEEQGLLAGAFSCKADKPGSLTASAFMVTDSTMMRRYLFTLTREINLRSGGPQEQGRELHHGKLRGQAGTTISSCRRWPRVSGISPKRSRTGSTAISRRRTISPTWPVPWSASSSGRSQGRTLKLRRAR